MTSGREKYPDLYPPEDWQETHPGESWLEWYARSHGHVWTGFVSPDHGWPMEGMSYGPCICPEHMP
jgi:hypothetical protein